MELKIAVFGSAIGSKKEIEEKAYIVGKEIAKQNCIVVSGGCGGLPYLASKGAFENKGKTIAFSPRADLDEHTNKNRFPEDVFSEFVFVPKDFSSLNDKSVCRKYRNVTSCAETDAGIIIGGRIGTINEFTNLYDMNKVIGILKGSEGATELIPQIIESANKKTGSVIIFEEDPVKLVEKIVNELRSRGGLK
jgi:predicted Rossmann-fold nucleotide-binding protein